ncbi:hypothetical protein MBLNU13_g11380t1 [Cladosporium sp. NU13]
MQNKWKMDLQDFQNSEGDFKNAGGLHGEEGSFKLAFQNYAGIAYCEDTSKKRVNDGNLENSGGIAHPPSPETLDPPHRYFLTKRGVNLFIPAGAEIGDAVSSHGEDDNMEEDEIVALANATSIAE